MNKLFHSAQQTHLGQRSANRSRETADYIPESLMDIKSIEGIKIWIMQDHISSEAQS